MILFCSVLLMIFPLSDRFLDLFVSLRTPCPFFLLLFFHHSEFLKHCKVFTHHEIIIWGLKCMDKTLLFEAPTIFTPYTIHVCGLPPPPAGLSPSRFLFCPILKICLVINHNSVTRITTHSFSFLSAIQAS